MECSNAIKEGGTSRSGLSRTKIRSWVEEVHGDLTLGRFNKELSRAMDMDLIRQIVQHFVLTDKAKAELKVTALAPPHFSAATHTSTSHCLPLHIRGVLFRWCELRRVWWSAVATQRRGWR